MPRQEPFRGETARLKEWYEVLGNKNIQRRKEILMKKRASISMGKQRGLSVRRMGSGQSGKPRKPRHQDILITRPLRTDAEPLGELSTSYSLHELTIPYTQNGKAEQDMRTLVDQEDS